MLRMAQVQYIKDLYENEEKSLREISRITGHSFETVQKYAQKENWSEDNLPDTEPTSYPVLGEFILNVSTNIDNISVRGRRQANYLRTAAQKLRRINKEIPWAVGFGNTESFSVG